MNNEREVLIRHIESKKETKMKRFNWLLVSLVVLSLASLPLVGCGIPKSEYEALQGKNASLIEENTSLKAEVVEVQSDLTKAQADHDMLKSDHDKLSADYETIEAELAEIKEAYPPRHFDSRMELVDWRNEIGTVDSNLAYIDACRKLQEIALADGYIISININWENQWVASLTAIAGDSIYQMWPDEYEVSYITQAY
jgi:chromosome segregation ATPase